MSVITENYLAGPLLENAIESTFSPPLSSFDRSTHLPYFMIRLQDIKQREGVVRQLTGNEG